jgi:hypothetical protein
MRLDFCAACGERAADKLEHHHMIPRSAGGADDDTNLLTLCHTCHGKFHGYERLHIRALTRAGIEAARARGVKIGNPRMHLPEYREKMKAGREAARNAQVLNSADAVVPLIQSMRPKRTWPEVATALNTAGAAKQDLKPWTGPAIARAAKRLVALGRLSETVLDRATWQGKSPEATVDAWKTTGTVAVWKYRDKCKVGHTTTDSNR